MFHKFRLLFPNIVRRISSSLALLLLTASILVPLPVVTYAQGELEEIVVTARKREESLVDTPISITAFTADDLDVRQITSINQIDESTPNLMFKVGTANSGFGGAATVFIRGIGQTDFLLTNEPGVGIYLDGVYLSQTVGQVLDLVDVETIEVLRGPQGTLFGRNTTGGAVSVNSKRPHEEFDGNIEIIAGSYNRIDVKGRVNIPITDKLFINAAALSTDRDGFINTPNVSGSSGFGDDNTVAARFAARWLPSDNIDVNLAMDYTRSRENGAPFVLRDISLVPGSEAEVWNRVTAPALGQGQYTAAQYLRDLDDHTSFAAQPGSDNLDLWGVGLTIDWDVNEFLSIRSITSYRNLESNTINDGDHSPLTVNEVADTLNQDQFSQELQFKGTLLDNRLDWILGLYHFQEEGFNRNPVVFPLELGPGFAPLLDIQSGAGIDNESNAVFAQLSYDLTDQLSLTGGLRYTDEEKVAIVTPDIQVIGIPGIGVLPTVVPGKSKASVSEVTPYANVSYAWTDDLMTYFSYSEGFRSGGFAQRLGPPFFRPGLPSFDPEFVTVYEVGFKWTGLNNRIRITGAGFFTDYEDLQLTVDAGVGPVTDNAAKAEIKGFELELLAVPMEHMKISGGVGYLDASYEEVATTSPTITTASLLVNTPEWNLNASASYTWAVPGLRGTITPRVDWSYTSEHATEAENIPLLIEGGYSLLNASITYVHDSEKWELTVFGKNLTDETYITAGFGTPSVVGLTQAIIGRPAEIGARLKYNF